MSVMAVDQWVTDLFRAIDNMDAGTFANAFTEDGTFRFGNSEPVVGRLQVEQSVSGFFSILGGAEPPRHRRVVGQLGRRRSGQRRGGGHLHTQGRHPDPGDSSDEHHAHGGGSNQGLPGVRRYLTAVGRAGMRTPPGS
jgi:SnoaL-like domain